MSREAASTPRPGASPMHITEHRDEEQKIWCQVDVQRQNRYYGKLVVSSLHSDGGELVRANQFLSVVFLSPTDVAARDFSSSTAVKITPQMINEQIDANTVRVTARLKLETAYEFQDHDALEFGVYDDVGQNPELYKESFVLVADRTPSGCVAIHCEPAPDERLANCMQTICFCEGKRVQTVSVPLGQETQCKIGVGSYTDVKALKLTAADDTAVGQPQASTHTLRVEDGGRKHVDIRYDHVEHFSTIDVTVGNIRPLERERFHIRIQRNGAEVASNWSPGDHKTRFSELPQEGDVSVSVDPMTVNNEEFSFKPRDLKLSSRLDTASFPQADAVTGIDTTGFVSLPIVVKTSIVESGLTLFVRLRCETSTLIYTQTVPVRDGPVPRAVKVRPGQYTVEAPSFVRSGIVYVVTAGASLTVLDCGSSKLEVQVQRGANLKVRGFPDVLGFGGYADLVDGNKDDFVEAKASSVFAYAGLDHDGDPLRRLTEAEERRATWETIQLARAVERELGHGKPVLPVMVSYTCNLQGFQVQDRLRNHEDWLANSFANLILSLQIANSTMDPQHLVPGGYIVNPDFVSTCQREGLTAKFTMTVRGPLQSAIDYRKVAADIPDSISEDLGGYVAAVNWLFRTVSPAVPFGWHVHLEGAGGPEWIYQDDDDAASMAQKTGAYAASLGIFAHADFVAVGRNPGDDFTVQSYGVGYCYGPREWQRFFAFCGALSLSQQVPVLPWQVSLSRTPLVDDGVAQDFDFQHWGTGGSYILGDAAVGSSYHNVHPNILQLKFTLPYMGEDGRRIFIRAEPFDLTEPAVKDLLLCGIFTVLVGGPSTTGIIVASFGNRGPWVRKKLKAYGENPIRFGNYRQGS
ncbi:hypothetical protein X797_008727 [Metarhizium robertsii]|uniref:Uncharacterized protein n=2 Tax=Metarhizium robertsii TaxID=568076 RepID=E9F6U6_METRA|nr:uncharacterized protein MAA_07995 [Metarhizium robertsii ARSEF 23]EFY96498.1 hypothetical protein MAA_07995 [Metarhizium robertsii ARSEF 23]EXU98120.1 hypothetical protein X797_008727 [Metarhizium robertsii]